MNNKNKWIGIVISSLVLIYASLPLVAYAQGPPPPPLPGPLNKGINDVENAFAQPNSGVIKDDVVTLITKIINWLLGIAAVVALLVIIVGGIWYIGSLGEEKQLGKAKHIVMYAIIGLLVIGLSFAAIQAVRKILTGT